MSDDTFTPCMNLLIAAGATLALIPEDDIEELSRALNQADVIGFLFVSPLQYQAGIDRRRALREYIAAVRSLRAARAKLETFAS